jgi:hypothetical protein
MHNIALSFNGNYIYTFKHGIIYRCLILISHEGVSNVYDVVMSGFLGRKEKHLNYV